MKTYNMLLMT